MWCPRCGAEWREGITTCPDCDVPLVDSPPEPSRDDAELISVFETSDADTLPVVKSALDAAGIPYLVQGDEAFGLLPAGGVSGFFGKQGLGVAILVPADRADEARELLAEDAQSDEPALDE
ncbi:MAG: putative signal transducing protein [Thermoanaerobaculia bacterium]